MPAPDAFLRSMLNDYHAMRGPSHYVPADPDLGRRIADVYDAAYHDPLNPHVQAAYGAFISETIRQFAAAEVQGFIFEPWTKDGQPYRGSNDMKRDARRRHHLYFFLGGELLPGHPLGRPSNLEIAGRALTCNDVFRAVHDLYGHAKEGLEFGPRGEENAWREHAHFYSRLARKARTTETRGQNSWFLYGPHLRRADGSLPLPVDRDFVPLAQRPYAPQKACLLPDWCWDE